MTGVRIRMYFKDIRKAIKMDGLFIFGADPSFAYLSLVSFQRFREISLY